MEINLINIDVKRQFYYELDEFLSAIVGFRKRKFSRISQQIFFFRYTIPLPTFSINAISDNGFLTLGVNAFSFIL